MSTDIYELNNIAQRHIKQLGEEADNELVDGYDQFEVKVSIFGGKPIATVQWPSWRLDLCSFVIDDTVTATSLTVSDSTFVVVENGDDKLISKNNNSDKSRDWDIMEKAPVWMVLDHFLSGTWTPPWRCGFCRDRIKGISRPKW